MTSSTLDAAPATTKVAGPVSNAEPHVHRSRELRDAFARVADPHYFDWLDHVHAAAGCTRPVRLRGHLLTVDGATGDVLDRRHTDDLPDAAIYKPCGNRRARVCPTCSATYQADAYQLLRAGLVGGKGVPETVSEHHANFATFTAPSFGPVHSRHITRHTCVDRRRCRCRPDPCHPRRDTGPCPHGLPPTCFTRHDVADRALGQPLCLDCYDHDHQVVWNLYAGELWRRTKQAIERHLAHTARRRGIPSTYATSVDGKRRRVPTVRISHGKAAEFQARGAVHFHTLLRLDGVDPHNPDAVVPPPAALTAADLDAAIRAAVAQVAFTTPPHPDRPTGWHISWGQQVDTRPISLSGHGAITDGMVAGYLAKYATKSTEATGHSSTRISPDTIAIWADPDTHTGRLVDACWRLGRNLHAAHDDQGDDDNPYSRLRRWAHMLGFGGHFLTKARRYSITFAILRENRVIYRRSETAPDRSADGHQDTTLIVGLLTYAGTGWRTTGDALLANTAAAQARERHRAGREELAQLAAGPDSAAAHLI